MKIKISQLLRRIPNMKILHSNLAAGRSYERVRLIYTDTPLVNDEVVYVGSASFFPIALDYLTSCCLIIRCNDNRDFSNLNCDYILIDVSSNIIDIYETLQGIWTTIECNKCLAFYIRLTATGSIIDMIALAAQTLDCPILVTNENSQLLTYSGSEFMDDPAFSEIILSGHTSNLHVQASTQDGTAQTVMEVAEIPTMVGLGRYRKRKRILGNVMIGGVKRGFVLALQTKREFTSFDIMQIATICDAAAYLAIQSAGNESHANLANLLHQNHLQSLLSSDSISKEALEKWVLPCKGGNSRFWIFAADANLEQPNDVPLVESLRELCRGFHVLSCDYEQTFVILLNGNTDAIPDQLQTTLTELMHTYRRYVGISRRFSQLCEIREMYHQAQNALAICKRLSWNNTLAFYQELKTYQLLLWVNQDRLTQEFYDDALDRLQLYDRQKGTQYYKTLYTYLKCACNRSAAAKCLYLHRNTIAYQLNKIAEILVIDLNDGERCLQLYLSCKINDLQ